MKGRSLDRPGVAQFSLGQVRLQKGIPAGATGAVFNHVRLPAGAGRLECYVEQNGEQIGARAVELRRIR